MLEVGGLVAGYNSNAAVEELSMEAAGGEITTIIGANGAGKTTLLRALSGLLRARSGSIRFLGEDITNLPPSEIVRKGICQVPEGRQLFPRMTVQENLLLGAFLRSDQRKIDADLERVYAFFPILKEKAKLSARSLSGGQQQMLAFGRALMAGPKMLLLDEPSVGLAPAIEHQLMGTIRKISAEHGMGVLLVEQNANLALSVSKRAFVLELGKIALSGPADELISDPTVRKAYLGL